MQYAPIVIFAFNRLESLKATVESILKNTESTDSDLFIFVDGARQNKVGEIEKVDAVHEYIKSISGFNSLHYSFSEKNLGLGPSIINGVSEVINKYGTAIIIEDDLIVHQNFLKYMNESLRKYKDEKMAWSICGYSNKVVIPSEYQYDAYFCPRSSSWGWATWIDRWNSVDWSFKNWNEWKRLKRDFNKWGGSDCFSMLEGCKNGSNKSWAIRFCFNQFLQDKLSLFPNKSLVINDGFDGSGTNCKKFSRFKYELMSEDKKNFNLPPSAFVNLKIIKSALKYHSIRKRLWSKIMYLITK